MKTFVFAFTLLLSVSLGHASNENIINYIKDGFDTVYKFDLKMSVSQGLRHIPPTTMHFDVFFRKSSSEDPKKFLLYFDNVRVQDIDVRNQLPTSNEPIVFTIKDDGIDEIFATEDDIKRTVDLKSSVASMMFQNITANLMKDHSTSSCETPTTFNQTDKYFGVEVSIKSDDCIGKQILEKGRDTGVRKIDIDAKYYYEKETGQLTNTYVKLGGKILKGWPQNIEVDISIVTDYHFDGYKAIQEEIDETKITRKHEKKGFFSDFV